MPNTCHLKNNDNEDVELTKTTSFLLIKHNQLQMQLDLKTSCSNNKGIVLQKFELMLNGDQKKCRILKIKKIISNTEKGNESTRGIFYLCNLSIKEEIHVTPFGKNTITLLDYRA